VIKAKGQTILGADNKISIAVILEVLERLQQEIHRPIEILFTVDEESTNNGAKLFDYSKLKSKRGLIMDCALPIGSIVIASPAYTRFDIEIIGKAGHAAYPDRANNILPALGALLSTSITGKLDEQSILNVGLGEFGSSRNTIPGTAVLRGEIRSFDETLLVMHTKTFLSKVKAVEEKFKVVTKITSAIDNPGYIFTKGESIVKDIAALLEEQKIKPTYVKSWAVSDANVFNTKGLQVVNIGDGVSDAHTLEEHVKIADMEKLTGIVQHYCTLIEE
jgi:tripeptide aminopeptidase